MRFFLTGPRFYGVRPGVSVGADELAGLFKQPQAGRSAMTGSFVYVVKGEHGRSKIGVSTNPLSRLGQLQTGSAHRIELAYVAATPGTGYDIESEVKQLMQRHQTSGEWFDVPPETLVAAIHGVSHRIGQPVQQVQPEWIPEILRQAALPGPAQAKRRSPALLFAALFVVVFIVVFTLIRAMSD